MIFIFIFKIKGSKTDHLSWKAHLTRLLVLWTCLSAIIKTTITLNLWKLKQEKCLHLNFCSPSCFPRLKKHPPHASLFLSLFSLPLRSSELWCSPVTTPLRFLFFLLVNNGVLFQSSSLVKYCCILLPFPDASHGEISVGPRFTTPPSFLLLSPSVTSLSFPLSFLGP